MDPERDAGLRGFKICRTKQRHELHNFKLHSGCKQPKNLRMPGGSDRKAI
jgi:hypothetical protein